MAGSEPFMSAMTMLARTTPGAASQTSDTARVTTMSRSRPSGGQRVAGAALALIVGAPWSPTVTVTVSAATEPSPSRTVRPTTQVPRGTVTVGCGPVAIPNGPVHSY